MTGIKRIILDAVQDAIACANTGIDFDISEYYKRAEDESNRLEKLCYSEIAGQKLHELKLHETMTVYGGEHLTIECMRVPGGFVYQYSEYHPSENEHLTTSTVFVPEPTQLEYCTTQEINMDKLFEE